MAVAVVAPPVLLLPALLGLATAVAVGRVALLGRLWDSRATTAAATLLYAGLVAAGVLDLAVDVESLVAQRPPLIEGLP